MSRHPKEYASNAEVKWCPGCGDYAILQAIHKALSVLDLAPEKTVFVSGIGCAGRLPYYVNAYGFHTVHGRAPAVATGISLMRDDLSVWVIVGDGDGLSIGLHHLLHLIRRDLKVNVLLINNQVYGLTKGQASPTSVSGQKTRTTMEGVSERSLNPLALALASGASFVARGVDKNPKQLADLFVQAEKHQGCSFVEIFQNCNVFNDGAFDYFSDKSQRKSNTFNLSSGTPILTETEDQGINFASSDLLVDVDKTTKASLHDEQNLAQAMALANLDRLNAPVPLGVLYRKECPHSRKALKFASKDELNVLLEQ